MPPPGQMAAGGKGGFSGLGGMSSQLQFAVAMADMMSAKTISDAAPSKKAEVPVAAAFDKDMLARLAQQAAAAAAAEPAQWKEAPQPASMERGSTCSGKAEDAASVSHVLPHGHTFAEEPSQAQRRVGALAAVGVGVPCPQCSTEFTEDCLFCRKCGCRRPEDPTLCKQCGTGFTEDSLFCRKCGLRRADPPGASSSSAPQDSGQFLPTESQQPSKDGEKSQQAKQHILDNVLGALKATAFRSHRSAAVAPPVVTPVAKPPSAPRLPVESGLPEEAGIYLPPKLTAQVASKPERPCHRSRSDPRAKKAASPRPARREVRSASRDKSKRSRSGARGKRSRSRRRGGGFSEKPAKASKFGDTGSQVVATNKRELMGRKALRMPDAYIRSLLGRGGDTVKMIISRTGASITVDHKPGEPEGLVTIANNIDKAMVLIKEVLESRGCNWSIEETSDEFGKVFQVGWKGTVAMGDVQIPTELVGLFIGNGGDSVQKIKNLVGGALTVKILPPILPGGVQVIQVVGDNWKAARELVRQEVKRIMLATPGRWHAPGFGGADGLNPAGGSVPAHAGYMAGFGATPGLSYSKEPQREGQTMNMVAFSGASL